MFNSQPNFINKIISGLNNMELSEIDSLLDSTFDLAQQIENFVNTNFPHYTKERRSELEALYPILDTLRLIYGDEYLSSITNLLSNNHKELSLYAEYLIKHSSSDNEISNSCQPDKIKDEPKNGIAELEVFDVSKDSKITDNFSVKLNLGPFDGKYKFIYTGSHENIIKILSNILECNTGDFLTLIKHFDIVLLASEEFKSVEILKSKDLVVSDFLTSFVKAKPTMIKKSLFRHVMHPITADEDFSYRDLLLIDMDK